MHQKFKTRLFELKNLKIPFPTPHPSAPRLSRDLGLRGDCHGSYGLLATPSWAPGLPPAKSCHDAHVHTVYVSIIWLRTM